MCWLRQKLNDEQRRALTALVIKRILRAFRMRAKSLSSRKSALIHFGKVPVPVPPGAASLQATAEAEETMAALVLAHLGKARRVADLFCGVGTFALRIAEKSAVHAVENDAAALAASIAACAMCRA